MWKQIMAETFTREAETQQEKQKDSFWNLWIQGICGPTEDM